MIRRDPAFAVTALATLALGIRPQHAISPSPTACSGVPAVSQSDRLVIVSSAQQTETGVKTFWNGRP